MTRPKPWVNPRGARAAKGKDAQVRNSLHFWQDTTLLFCHLTYKLLLKSNLPAQIRLDEGLRQSSANKINVQTCKNLRCFKQTAFITKVVRLQS
jgi:hypothetical protein